MCLGASAANAAALQGDQALLHAPGVFSNVSAPVYAIYQFTHTIGNTCAECSASHVLDEQHISNTLATHYLSHVLYEQGVVVVGDDVVLIRCLLELRVLLLG